MFKYSNIHVKQQMLMYSSFMILPKIVFMLRMFGNLPGVISVI